MATRKGLGLNERALIADIFAPLAASTPGALNLKDDAAFLVPPAGKDLVITTDVLVAGVHFFKDDPADTIAAKALRVNLSDLAAKGAEPLGYTLCLALTSETQLEWVRKFARGLRCDQETYDIQLYGGDTVKTPGPLSISITAFGAVDKGAMIQRAGAQAGDHVYVSGTIGDGALGLSVASADKALPLDVLNDDDREYLLERYRLPQPRCALVPSLARYANAAMDISDGLIGDIGALVSVSEVSADIMIERIPLSSAVQKLVAGDNTLLQRALCGGDDYEIVCTVAPQYAQEFEECARRCDVRVTNIGAIIECTRLLRFLDASGNPVKFSTTRYEH